MKKLKNTMKKIATLGMTAVLLTNSFPAAAFAAGIDGTEPAIVIDTELPESSEEAFAGEGEGTSDEVLSEGHTEVSEGEASEDKVGEDSGEGISGKELPDEKDDTTEDAVTPSTVSSSDGPDENDKKESKEERQEYPAFEKTATVNGVKITVEADEGVFPEGAELSVKRAGYADRKHAEEAVEDARDEEQNVAKSYTFDIKVFDKDGNEIEPADESKVKVSFTLDEVADENLMTNVYHIVETDSQNCDVSEDTVPGETDNTKSGGNEGENAGSSTELTAEKLSLETNGDTAVAETDGFSLYTVEFTYNNLQYVLPGDSSIELSEILDKVGLTGEISIVEVSDESLFSADKENEEWVVTAHKAFSTDEWMKVTIDGVVYEITVTDDVTITKLWVGASAQVTSTGVISDTGATQGTATVSVEGGSVVLTLDNFVYSGTGNSGGGSGSNLYAIYYDGTAPLVIDLIGTNSITHNDAYKTNGYGIRGYQDLTIRSTSGSGSLTFSHTSNAGYRYAIYNYGNIKLAGGTVTATTASNEGIQADGDLILAGATVTASKYSVLGNGKVIKVAAGKTYYVDNTPYTGTLTDEQIAAIAGKTMTCPTTTLTASVDTFSNVTAGSYTPVANPIVIANTGTISATIESVTLSGDSADAFELNKTGGATIAAGATDNTTYTVSPKSGLAAGTYTATVTVLYGGDQTATADVSIIVEAPEDYVTAAAPTFDNAYGTYAQPAAKAITLNNLGGSTVTINSVSLTGTNKDSFTLNKTDNTTIAASTIDRTTYTIRPNAGLSVGTYEATISVTYAGNKTATTDVSFTVDTPLEVIAPTFDSALDGYYEISAQAITIDNRNGIVDKDIASVTLTGTDASSFTLNKTGGTTMAVGATDSSYTVKPIWRLGVGTYTATVTVTYNGGATATADVCFTVTDGARHGTLGTVTWDISEDWKTLTFSGTGEASGLNLKVYYATRIETIVINEGITGIGEHALSSSESYSNFNHVTSVTLPSTLRSIYSGEFSACSALETIHFGGTKTQWNAVSKPDAQIRSGTKMIYNIAGCAFADVEYTGAALEPMVMDGTTALVKDTDYTMDSVSNNTNAGTATATITGKGDYEGTKTATFTIKQKPVTITGLSAESKTYDGTTNATVTGTAVVDGKIGEDDVTVAAGSAAFEDADVGTDKTVTFSGYSLSGTAAGNYAISAQPASVTANITAKVVTITAKDQSIYVGGAVPSLSGEDFYTVSGLVGEETLTTNPTLVYQKNGSVVTPDNTVAGTYDIVPSGASASDNYSISYTNGTLTITDKAMQTVSAEDVTATYGDTGKKIEASTSGDGALSYTIKSGDAVIVDASGNLTIVKAGSAVITVTAAETDTYAQATKDITVTINKANAVAATVIANNRTYDGTGKPLVTVDGEPTGGTMYYALGDNATTAPADNLYTTSIPAKTDAGTYYVWYKVVGDSNHNDIDPAGPINVEIAKATTQNPTSVTRKYLYSRNNSDSFTLTGLPADCGTVTWKNPSITGSVSYTTDPSITLAGILSYTIASGNEGISGTIIVVAETQNYEDVTFTINIMLVNQIPVKLKDGSSVTLASSTLTYGQALSALTFNSAVFVSDDEAGNTVTGSLAWKEPTTVPDAGTTSAAWIFTPTDGAYASLEGTVAISVNKKNISGATVTLDSALTYNGSEQTQSVSKIELSGTDITSYCEISGNKGTNAGSYTLTITAKADSNYTGSVTKSFTIAKKAITPTVVVSGSYSYTGSAITPTVSVKDGSNELASTDYSISVTDNINAGKGKVTVSAKTDGNYSFDAKTVEFDINKASHNNETASAELKYGLNGSLELASFVAPGATCELGTISDADSVLSGTPSVAGTVLSFGFKTDAEAGKSATVTVHVKNATNYLDYDITATLTVIDCAHEHTEIRDAKAATCTEQGYTGDTYCTECGKKISSGTATPIDSNNHAYDDGVITKQPTIFEEGIKTYTCIRCHHTYSETVPRVDDGEDHSDLIDDVTDDDGQTKAEVKTEQKEDGSTETTVTVGGQEVEKTVKDADGNETIQTQIWVGGLSASYHYTGSAIKPAIHVYDGTKKLKSGTDYSISYKNNTKVGTNATITITFKGNYKGTAQEKLSFTITPAVLGEDVKALDFAVAGTGKVQKPAPTLVWTSTGKTVSGKNFSFAYKDASGNDVTRVKDSGIYTVIVTPKNSSFNGSTTATITVTSKKLLLSKAAVTLKPNKYTYTGDPIIPPSGSYTLKVSGVTLTENTDYVVADVTNNINAGTATIIFAAKEGNTAGYAGTKSTTFKIVKGRELKQGDGFTYSYSASVPYAKGGAKPSVIVKDGEDTLVLNKDYTVSYSKNTAVTNGATAIMTVKGKGNYRGSVKLYYAVTTQNIANLKNGITVEDKQESKKGYKNPTVTIVDLDGKKLKAGTDFKIGTDYSDPDADGKVTVTVFGNGKYGGSIQVSYRYIKAAQQISKAKAMKSIATQTYTGKAIRLKNSDLTGILYVGNKKTPTYLVPGTDFVVLSYSNNTKAGTAKVILRGIGNYGSTKTLTFKIKQKKGDYKGALVGGEWTN